jgi:hypothetical protein
VLFTDTVAIQEFTVMFSLEVDMGRRGYSTSIGKFAKIHRDRRVSEIRRLGRELRDEQRVVGPSDDSERDAPPSVLRA